MNLPPSRYLKECLKSVNILKNYGQECVDTFLIYVGRGFFRATMYVVFTV